MFFEIRLLGPGGEAMARREVQGQPVTAYRMARLLGRLYGADRILIRSIDDDRRRARIAARIAMLSLLLTLQIGQTVMVDDHPMIRTRPAATRSITRGRKDDV